MRRRGWSRRMGQRSYRDLSVDRDKRKSAPSQALPYLAVNLADAPEPLLRRLFEATSLTIKITDDGDHVTISDRLPADAMPRSSAPLKRSTTRPVNHTKCQVTA